MRRCTGRGMCHLSFLGMSPTSKLFDVEVDGLVPPQQVHAPQGRRPCGKGSSVTVGSTHPANVAAAKKQADFASRVAAVPTLESPKRGAKPVMDDRIAAQLLPHERVPVASVVPRGARWFGDYDDTDGRGGCA
jgi:hypothetical protein